MPCFSASGIVARAPMRRFGQRRDPFRVSFHLVRKVLVVDDSAVARVTLKKRIEARGLAVETKESVADCGGLDATAFDAAILDYDLGDGTGTDVATLLRESAPSLPIAFVTASDDTKSLEAARAFGPVFTKPEIDHAVEWASSARPRS
jgi:CheY-like chemotaxis protein